MTPAPNSDAVIAATQANPGLGRTALSDRRPLAGALNSAPYLAAGTISVALVLGLAWDAGGYFPASYLTAGEISFFALALLIALRHPPHPLSVSALLALAALIALTAWTGIATTWSPAPDVGVLDMQRTLAHLGLFGLGVYAAGSGRFSRHLVWGALGAMAVIVGAGLLSRLYPGVFAGSASDAVFYRLSYPLSYWNAFGAMAAMTAVLALGLAARPRAHIALRSLMAAVAVLAFAAMYFSLSRGSWVALIIGVVALGTLSPYRLSLLNSVLIVGGIGALVLLRLRSFDLLVNGPLVEAVGQGHSFAPELGGFALLAAAIQAATATVGGQLRLRAVHAGSPAARRGAAFAGATVLVVSAGLYGVAHNRIEGGVSNGMNRTADFFSREYRDFMHAGALSTDGTARLTSARGTRSEVYRVALQGFSNNPAAGDGAGSFETRWMRERRVAEKLRNAHSLYLETMDELGLLGLLPLALFLGAIVAAILRTRSRPAALGSGQVAAVAAALTVWAVHGAVDWDWQISALTGSALLLAAAVLPQGRRGRRRQTPAAKAVAAGAETSRNIGWLLSPRVAALLCAAGCLLIGVQFALHRGDELKLARANDLGLHRRYVEALGVAAQIKRNPTVGRALVVQSQADTALGRILQASIALRFAASHAPQDWEIRTAWAATLLALEDRRAARQQIDRALHLNPKLLPPPGFCGVPGPFGMSLRCAGRSRA
ncbi:MAG: hypothetical protein ACR2ND_05225 [Solirubrobacteraceae bacterium]